MYVNIAFSGLVIWGCWGRGFRFHWLYRHDNTIDSLRASARKGVRGLGVQELGRGHLASSTDVQLTASHVCCCMSLLHCLSEHMTPPHVAPHRIARHRARNAAKTAAPQSRSHGAGMAMRSQAFASGRNVRASRGEGPIAEIGEDRHIVSIVIWMF